MTPSLMLLGTHSNAGKSLLTTAFCRILARQGYRVAPFKAQNMSNNAGVTLTGGEMGRAQIVQAEAAGIVPHMDMNPVLLKPEADRRSQIILNGSPAGHIEAANWLDIKKMLWREVQSAYDRLASRFDVIVLEGAGSPAEINLKAGDIVNLRMARHANAPCLLVGDIDRGGVFAALAGTLLLLEAEERAQIRGFLINKFRGDPSLLGNATQMLQAKAFGTPSLGVIPFVPDLRIADEDAVVLDTARGPAAPGQIDIAVIHLPHIANFDEFAPLADEAGVHLRYVRQADELGKPHAVILPGTKATLADLAWLRGRGLDQAIRQSYSNGATVVGICGGYQLLGCHLADRLGVENSTESSAVGLGLLPVSTEFQPIKQTHQARMQLADGQIVDGYEIHAGDTYRQDGATPFGEVIQRGDAPVAILDGAVSGDGRVWGCYLHGIFGNDHFRHQWLAKLGWNRPEGNLPSAKSRREAEYDRLADVVEEAVDWSQISGLMGI